MQATSNSNILAFDVGERRIGLALAGSIARIPQPLKTLQNNEEVWNEISNTIEKEAVGVVVVGLPRGLDGQETDQTRQVRKFGEELEQKTGLGVVWQDEALTSKQAEAELAARHKTYDKGMIDALAATYILEDYLRDNDRRQAK